MYTAMVLTALCNMIYLALHVKQFLSAAVEQGGGAGVS